jgi:hypothetical protein
MRRPSLDDAQHALQEDPEKPLPVRASSPEPNARRVSTRSPPKIGEARRQLLGATTPWYIIDPRESSWLQSWDLFTSLGLLFVAFVTPFEIALLGVKVRAQAGAGGSSLSACTHNPVGASVG